ncbi:putative dihydrolipoyllysine-residue succinyltransferase, partial [Teladorsagia circumcincta]
MVGAFRKNLMEMQSSMQRHLLWIHCALVGHLNIGSGRPVYQDIVRINLSIKNDTLVKNEALVAACNRAKSGNGRIHLAGLVSDGGVHSHIDHLFALIKCIKQLGVPECFLHFYGDGRDTSPTSGVGFLEKTIAFMKEQAYCHLATIVGRYYAMDRDKRWERICVAYEAMIGGKGEACSVDEAPALVRKRYEAQETDEFLKPIILNGEKGRVRDGMTQYKKEFPFPTLFPPLSNKNVLAEWLAAQKLTQFHCAETEKYAHVTFFFNGGVEKQFDNEERCMVPSPKVYEAAVKACEATDAAIGRIFEACKANGYVLMVTADHGNAEKMKAPDGSKHTAHTCNRVPFTCSSNAFKFKK